MTDIKNDRKAVSHTVFVGKLSRVVSGRLQFLFRHLFHGLAMQKTRKLNVNRL